MLMTVMTNRFLFVLTISLSAVSHLFGPPAARAGDMTCSGLIGSARTATTIDGGVTVPAGTSCTLSFVSITGDVAVGPNATLVVSAYLEPSEIAGNIEASTCNSVLLQGNGDRRRKPEHQRVQRHGVERFPGAGRAHSGQFQVPVQHWTLLGVAGHRRRKCPNPIQQRASSVRCQPRQGRGKSRLPGQFAGGNPFAWAKLG
jgi:hypothetical protein